MDSINLLLDARLALTRRATVDRSYIQSGAKKVNETAATTSTNDIKDAANNATENLKQKASNVANDVDKRTDGAVTVSVPLFSQRGCAALTCCIPTLSSAGR